MDSVLLPIAITFLATAVGWLGKTLVGLTAEVKVNTSRVADLTVVLQETRGDVRVLQETIR